MQDSCLNQQTVEDLVAGELSEPDRNRLHRHLDACIVCQHVVAAQRKDHRLFEDICWAFRPNGQLNAASIWQLIESTKEYTVESLWGRGGQGLIFRATHKRLKRPVAIKVLGHWQENKEQSVRRFACEMEAIGKLDHPNIVRAYDAREIDGVLMLAMEFVPGLDLDEWVRTRESVSTKDACDLIRQAAMGLKHAHENGMVHGDIKPRNLLLSDCNVVKILDLGLSQIHNRSSTDVASELASKSMVEFDGSLGQSSIDHQFAAGTPDYMAPEQWNNQRMDQRTDVYGLGCTLFYLLAGHPPFGNVGIREKMLGHQSGEIPTLVNPNEPIPQLLNEVVRKMMAKRPQDRYQTVAEVLDALEPFCETQTAGRDISSLEVVDHLRNKSSMFSSWMVGAVLMGAILLGAVLFVTIYDFSRPPQIVVGGFDRNRGADMCLPYGAGMVQFRKHFLEQFPGAQLKETNELSPKFLSQIDVLFISSAGAQQEQPIILSRQEQQAVMEFVKRGGGAVILVDNNSFAEGQSDVANQSLLDVFELDVVGSMGGFQSISMTDDSHPVVNGPFGRVNRLQVLYPGYFDQLGPYAIGIGEYDREQFGVPVAVINPDRIAPGSGPVVLVADTGPFIDVESLFAMDDNPIFALNVMSWVAQQKTAEKRSFNRSELRDGSKINIDTGRNDDNKE
ncbi:MAG: serine/threonine-protein kinase [Planctomycetota bacterium]